jgi:hypothetical protein
MRSSLPPCQHGSAGEGGERCAPPMKREGSRRRMQGACGSGVLGGRGLPRRRHATLGVRAAEARQERTLASRAVPPCRTAPHDRRRAAASQMQPRAPRRLAVPRDGTSTAGASRSTAARSSSFVSRTHPILPPLLLSATRAQPAKRSLLLPWRCVCSCPSRSLLCRIGRLTSAATRARHRASRAPLSRVSKSARACACPLLSRRAPLSPSYLSTSILALPAATLPPLRAALSALLLRQQQRRTGASWRRPSPPPQRSCPA